ncbi:MAG: hypothetical protein ACE5HK_00755 [Candidatus Methylomirabilales bacterium]
MTELEIRFCPYCGVMRFEVSSDSEGGFVYCDLCGIDVPVEELVKTV